MINKSIKRGQAALDAFGYKRVALYSLADRYQ